jgi:V8-like Glu-specific endopeptidase
MRLHENDGRLIEKEVSAFKKALCDAYNDLQDLDSILQEHLGWKLKQIAPTNNYSNTFFEVIEYAESRSETRELLAAALIQRSRNQQLLTLANQFALEPPWEHYLPSASPQAPPAREASSPNPQPAQLSAEERLERKIHALDQSLNVVQWRKQLERLERQICRVKVQKSRENIYGTGLLVGPDLIMTNYHVVKEVIDGPLSPHKVRIYFDYKLDEKNQMQDQGAVCELADDWHSDHSENSDLDLQKHEHIPEVEAHKLDYALLRLKEKPGLTPINDGSQTIRGWMELPVEAYDFQPGDALFILHHPNGDPLQLDMNTQGFQAINQNRTRVWYTTSTDYGSSGAPCFNLKWQLVAIHQSGDPEYHQAAAYNQGIPLATIYAFLQKRGKGSLLNIPPPPPLPLPTYDTPTLEFALPEGAMNEQVRTLLRSKLETLLSNLARDEHQPVDLHEENLTTVASTLSIEEFLILSQEYMRVARSEVAEARRPFDGEGNLRPGHYTQAIESLSYINDCVCKICTLLNNVAALPDIIARARLEVTVKSDQIQKEIEDFRQDIEGSRGRVFDSKKRMEIRNKFGRLSEDLAKIVSLMGVK